MWQQLHTILSKNGVPHRTRADSLVTQAGTVRTFGPFAANHTGMILGGDPDAAEPVVVIR
ncbi:MAG: hypothetical protein KZQ80_08280 [Candidatus Thiodiazotropha sp. (ex Monitilora ramsayi)]|nr:hypothetical protein [Candidatus Thiodiazotropha sp. (ex Monitilora ramsayi)]